MRVMIMLKSDQATEAGQLPDEKLFAAMVKYNEELVNAGIMLAGEGLQPTSKGKRVRFSRGRPTVIDGPFAEAKEIVAGYWLWEVKSIDEAVEWVKRCPGTSDAENEIEIRPLYELDDLGPGFTPELRAQEARQRERIEKRRNR